MEVQEEGVVGVGRDDGKRVSRDGRFSEVRKLIIRWEVQEGGGKKLRIMTGSASQALDVE